MKNDGPNNKNHFLNGLALLCFVLLFIGGPGPYSSRTFTYAWGLGHLFGFALWTYLYLQWRVRQSLWRKFSEVLFLVLLLGAGTELLQALVGREATWQDLGNDLLGCLLVLVFAVELKNRLSGLQIWVLRAPVLFIVCWTVLPFAKVMTDDLIARQQFPLLSGFETPLELGRWGGNSTRQLNTQYVHSGSIALRVDLNSKRYPGVGLNHFPADWSAYRALQFHIFNPQSDPFEFHFRIHDQQHRENDNRHSDRFNIRLTALPGWSEMTVPLSKVVRAPKGRKMDLSKIAGMILFVGKLEQPRTIYLDEVKLVR